MVKTPFAILAAATLFGAAATQAGVVSNGTNLNGVSMNGVSLNGTNLNGALPVTSRAPVGMPLRSLAKKPLAVKATAHE